MIKVFDFKCSNNHIFEKFVSGETEVADCPECGLTAKRIISGGSFVLDAVSGEFPGATMKWARDHEKAAKKHNN